MKARFCVDWDDTLVEDRWPDQGPWLPGAVKALHALNRLGQVVIYSCRVAPMAFPSMPTPEEDTPRDPVDVARSVFLMKQMLKAEGLGHIEVWQRPYKPAATVYIDNRAVRFNGDWNETMEDVLDAVVPIVVNEVKGRTETPSVVEEALGEALPFDWAQAEMEDTIDGWTRPVQPWQETVLEQRGLLVEDPPYVREVERHPSSLRFVRRVEGWIALHDKKQQDYGSDADPFANVRGGAKKMGLPGWVGAVIRMNDKMERLNKAAKQYIETGSVSLANEGVIDSFDDMGVYSGIGATLFEEEA